MVPSRFVASLLVAVPVLVAAVAAKVTAAAAPAAPRSAAPNTLTAAERKAGWKLLFDGKSGEGWRGFKSDAFPAQGWVVKDGALVHERGVKAGDIVTAEQYDSFELRFEFRLTEGANSGLKYLVDEALVKEGRAGVSFEFQVLDDAKHPDAKLGKSGNRTCGSLYDLIAAAADKVVRPIGEWNEARLLVDGARVEHWLNGKQVLAFERGSPALKALIADSKYKSIAGFGEAARGHLLLQDHHDEVAFRNLKLRKLSSKPVKRPVNGK
jgi:hypothetical protein